MKRRVSEFEGSFGFLTDQIRGVHRDLLSFQTETEHRFTKVDERFDQADGRLERVERGVRGLREEMPAILSDAMREVLRERDGQSRK